MKISHNATARTLRTSGKGIERALERMLAKRAKGSTARLYTMLMYFLGFLDTELKKNTSRVSAKRFRSSLCLFLAEAYGAREKAFDAALAIELFHNFTLIHDDVEDRDEMRRGRPTLWKMWGINHAINSGDLQSLLVAELCVHVAQTPHVGKELADTLLSAFIEVIEGQYLDFELTDSAIHTRSVTEKQYLVMTQKKSGALVRVAAEAAGIAAKKNTKEKKYLRDYGLALGTAFQIADDYRSVWATEAQTGKDRYSDIREHKRTLPFFAARSLATRTARVRLESLYSLPRQLTDAEVAEALSILDATSAREYVLATIQTYAKRARFAAARLSLPTNTLFLLVNFVDMLVSENS